jgi:hypothetical protein
MACNEYEVLRGQWKSAHDEFSYFHVPDNKLLHGLSDREAKKFAKEAQAKESECYERMLAHKQNCPECATAAQRSIS